MDFFHIELEESARAREQAPRRCGWILRQIGHLYRIEENLRRSPAGPDKRAAVRMSRPEQQLHAGIDITCMCRSALRSQAASKWILKATSGIQ